MLSTKSAYDWGYGNLEKIKDATKDENLKGEIQKEMNELEEKGGYVSSDPKGQPQPRTVETPSEKNQLNQTKVASRKVVPQTTRKRVRVLLGRRSGNS
ncbi:MAG: hypothetical protein LBU14_05055 [Candidatus Peribacteria bacterium]|nr:hypothetical protein [Candidatus Peribacteria bacterium]